MLNFRVHCVVTQRWMKIRVPFAWFWYGEDEYGNPEVEAGTIGTGTPQPPVVQGPRLPSGEPPPLDGGMTRIEDLDRPDEDYEDGMRRAPDPLPTPPPYMTPAHRQQRRESMEERLERLERDLERAREGRDPNWRSR